MHVLSCSGIRGLDLLAAALLDTLRGGLFLLSQLAASSFQSISS